MCAKLETNLRLALDVRDGCREEDSQVCLSDKRQAIRTSSTRLDHTSLRGIDYSAMQHPYVPETLTLEGWQPIALSMQQIVVPFFSAFILVPLVLLAVFRL